MEVTWSCISRCVRMVDVAAVFVRKWLSALS